MTERSDKHKQLAKFGEFDEPNWNHARVQKAAAQAIAFIEAYFSRYAAKGMFAGELYAGVGRPDRPLGKFIHEAVLIRSGTYVVANPAKDIKGVPFSYRYDPAALDYMKSKLPKDTDLLMLSAVEVEANVASKLEEKYVDELTALDFVYKDSSDRLFHGLQNMPGIYKQKFWAAHGLPFNYDIEACAPAILQQLAAQYGQNWLVQEPIKKYLSNKAQMRQRVADLLGIEVPLAKRILNSLFNGARLQASWMCSVFRLLGNDPRLMRKLQDDVEVKLLRLSIANMWRLIGRRVGQNMRTGSKKWGVYFHYERMVLEVIKEYLAERSVKFFTEHDGFRTDREIDRAELSQVIRAKTGFDLKIKRES